MERVTEKQTICCSNNGSIIISATTSSLNVEQHGIILDNNNNSSSSSIKHFEKPTHHQDQTGWRKFVAFVGPGFLVSLAYLDPGNLETDLQAGANNKFELLWVILIGLVFALIIQSLAANLGVSTGKHLAELCKAEYPVIVNYCLWLLAEIAVIAADIPDVIGTAFALNLLLQIPVWCGVLLTGLNTILLLGLQKYGVRKLEMVIAILIFVMAACFFGELSYMKPPATDVIKGMFVPKVTNQRSTGDTIALLGALIMPHNLFLHSAIVLSRKIPNTVQDINQACRFFLLESGFALIIAFLINVAVVTVSGTACSRDITPEVAGQCSELTLNSASFLLKNVLGNKASVIYAVALLASGQSSAVNCTYAGQYIMQGFLDLKMKTWLRNLVTRSIAITPSLIVSIIGGSAGAGRLIVIASMILSFELPFALIPLLKFSSSSTKMGPHKNSIYVSGQPPFIFNQINDLTLYLIIIMSWILGLGIIGINVYYLTTSFIGWLIHSKLPKVANVFLGVMVFPLMVVYIVAVVYLVFRKDRVVTFIEPTKAATNAQDYLEGGITSHHDEELN